MRSRVIPGSSPTMARREPTSRLNSVDLPTFGRPTMARVGSCAVAIDLGILTISCCGGCDFSLQELVRFPGKYICRKRMPAASSNAKLLLQHVGAMSHDDLEKMQKVIESDCESVDLGEW